MGKKPRVLILSSVSIRVGPAKLAEDYYKALRENGIDCDLMLLEKEPDHPEYLYIRNKRTNKDLARLQKMFKTIGWNEHCFFYKYEWTPMIPAKDITNAITKQYDLVYTVFWQEAFSFQTMKYIYEKLHCLFIWACADYSTMSGGCHFVGDCERYKNGCGKCTAFDSHHWIHFTRKFLFTRLNVLYRRWVIKKIKPVIRVNKYMSEFYSQSYLWKNYPRIEPSFAPIINTEDFKPKDKIMAKEKYGIPHDKHVVLFGCQNIANPRKGISYMIDALDILRQRMTEKEAEDIIIVGIGNNSETISTQITFNYKPLPYVDINSLPDVYSMADCFVCASINDAGPMMVNQALCCGTPVVGFDMGAVQSVVKDKGTGYCARLKDSEDLAEGIYKILNLDDIEFRSLSNRCRELALNVSSYKSFADAVINIYNKYKVRQ